MAVEAATTPGELNPLWPLGTDQKAEGDNHIRLVKAVLQGWVGPNLKDEAELEGWVLSLVANAGAGYYKGNNGTRGAANVGDIFRVHSNTLDQDVTIEAGENALACGPITYNATLTVNGVVSIV